MQIGSVETWLTYESTAEFYTEFFIMLRKFRTVNNNNIIIINMEIVKACKESVQSLERLW